MANTFHNVSMICRKKKASLKLFSTDALPLKKHGPFMMKSLLSDPARLLAVDHPPLKVTLLVVIWNPPLEVQDF